jgi:3-hydroxyacyl-CoA dehydrogenase/enoyl-CoA hydratase/3-hydroxybutyryl-CoA epimerase
VSKKAPKRHYPAPYALIDLWVEHFGDERRMLDEEAKSVARLIAGDTAQNLVRLFFLQERMKGSAEGVEYKPALVHVVGAGVMGGDIAAWIALRGFRVTLQDTEPARVAPAIKRAYKLFKKKLKEPRLVQAAMDRLIPDTASDGVASADLVIEAIFESLEAKQSLFADIEPRMKPDAILATNTSSIPLEDMAAGLKNPERLVGLHFFNPVAQMKLVEVVRGAATSSGTVLKAAAFVKGIDRLPLVVKSAPGFLVNRILMPYLMEAMTMIEEGVSPVDVDAAALDFGMPMGPVTLADAVGLDICLHVGDILSTTMGWPSPPKRLRSMVESGKLGKKSGTGFYDFKKGKPVAPKLAADRRIPEGIGDRLLFRLVNEAVACIREGVVEDADLLDAGIVFGTGFAPFRGGPMNYVRNYGIEVSRKKLAALQKGYGARFAEDSGWATLEL